MYKEKFARNLKALIGEKSQSQIAKEIGISQQTLSRYISGQIEIGLENLVKIAKYFNESIDVLVGLKEY